jgi:hypothetical protein
VVPDGVKRNIEQRRNLISREGTLRLSSGDLDRWALRLGAGPLW